MGSHSPGYLPGSGIEPRSPALETESLPLATPGKPEEAFVFLQISVLKKAFGFQSRKLARAA